MASSNTGGHKKNVEIISVISFIEQAMKTLKGFGKLNFELWTIGNTEESL